MILFMINEKYYQDIKAFSGQFEVGLKLAAEVKAGAGVQHDRPIDKVVLCGMGGSSLIVEMVNNFLAAAGEKVLPVLAARGYSLPGFADGRTLAVLVSHSGNTEETLSCLEQALARAVPCAVFCSGGKLMELAEKNSLPLFQIPKGLQPRLSSGYMFAGLMQVLADAGYIKDYGREILAAAQKIPQLVDESAAKALAGELKDRVPLVYATDNIAGMARVCKIKFNENAKVQCFWNKFPELNHNEMVGWTRVLMAPYFIVLQSKFCHPRNARRVEVFKQLMEGKNLPVKVIEPAGETVLQEMLSTYTFMDYVTYYLAEAYGIDPEPVAMVEDFKKMLG